MDYFDLIKEAKGKGIATDKIWQSLSALSDVLEIVEEEHPHEYWEMMRDQHEIMYGCHYDEQFAKYDVSKIHYTNREGQKMTGSHWTKDQVVEATKGYTFPVGTTDWDKYVALNVFYADTCLVFDDAQIIKGGIQFFFKDEDGPSDGGKIWRYMSAMCD